MKTEEQVQIKIDQHIGSIAYLETFLGRSEDEGLNIDDQVLRDIEKMKYAKRALQWVLSDKEYLEPEIGYEVKDNQIEN